MIIFHAKRDGTVTTEPSFVPFGSSMADLIVLSEFDYALCTIKLVPASGLYIPDVVCNFVLSVDKTTVWTASLPPEVAKVAGTVTYQLVFTAADGTQQGTLQGTFTVPRGAITNMPDSAGDLEQKTISDVYNLLSNTYASFTGHESEITRLLSLVTVSGKVTISATDWTDITPYTALISIGDVLSAGDLILVAPADDGTKAAAETARLSMVVSGTVDGALDYVVFARAEGSEAPAEPMTFRYAVIRTGSDDAALVALIGVDAYGSGGESGTGGGVDEEAVKALIKATVPAWAQSENPPADAVQSVNGQMGAVSLTAADVGARPVTWTPTATDVGADPSGAAESKVSAHNTETAAHNDIRLLIQSLSDRLTALAALLNSDDITLDETKEIVDYIKSNKSLIDSITVSKVNVTDIINDLVTNVDNKPLSAAQGVALKALIDALTTTVESKQTAEQVTAAISEALKEYAKTSDIPTVPATLPNPHALVIFGVNYDGSAAVEVTAEAIINALKEAGAVVGYVGDDNNIYLSGNLTAGTYTAYYELTSADGTKSLVEIGELTLAEDETDEPEPVTYTVTWVNYDGTVLETDTVTGGETPTYDGATPTRVADSEYTYTFTGWTPTVVAATADSTYTAVYEQTAVEGEPTNFFKSTPTVNTQATAPQDALVLGGRLNASAEYRVDGGPACLLSNYIPVQNGDTVEMTNLSLQTTLYSGMYTANKTIIGAFLSSDTAYVKNISTSGNVQSFTISNADAGYVRICGAPSNSIKVDASATDVTSRYDCSKIVIHVKREGAYL